MDESAGGRAEPSDHDIDAVSTKKELAELLCAFHIRHGRRTQRKLTYRQIARQTGYSVGTISNYLKGHTLPNSERLTDLLTVFDVSDDERAAMLNARDRVEDQRGPRTKTAQQDHHSGFGSDRGRPRRGFLARISPHVLVAALAGVALVAVVAALQMYPGSPDAPSGASRASYPPEEVYLAGLPQPQPAERWKHLDSACTPQRTHTHRFPVDFVGVVYVHIAGPPDRVMATLRLSWGVNTWTEDVLIEPGLLRQGQGGTLVAFTKGSVDRSAPALTFTTSVPACAVFGTSETSPPPAPSTKKVAAGWVRQ